MRSNEATQGISFHYKVSNSRVYQAKLITSLVSIDYRRDTCVCVTAADPDIMGILSPVISFFVRTICSALFMVT